MAQNSPAVRLASPRAIFRFMDAKSWMFFVIGLTGAVATGALLPVIGPLIGTAFNNLGSAGNTADVVSAINQTCLKIVYIGLGLFGASVLQTVGSSIAGARVMARAKGECLSLALNQDCAFYDSVSAGKVSHIMHAECTVVGQLIIDKLPLIATTIATFISALVLAFTASWDVTLVALACIPVILAAVYITTNMSLGADKQSLDALQVASAYAKEVFGNIRTVFSFDAGERSADTYVKKLDEPLKAGCRASAIHGVQLGVLRFTSFAIIPLILWYGGLQVSRGKLNGGQVFSVLSPLLMAVMSLAQNAPKIKSVPLALMSAYEVQEFLDGEGRGAEASEKKQEGMELVEVAGNVSLDNLRFAYPVSPNKEVLFGVSLNIPAGKTAALVGESGSGKSTIVSLLLRLYEPTGGRILLDGHDARMIALKSYRQHIGLVSQEPVLFASTIAENIGFGKQGATLDEIKGAAQAAQIHEFIKSLPEGYETLVGEKGTQLSGGQKQRVAIARAFLKAPKIFVLDEATSALDTQSERAIQDALRTLTKGCTTISIAHRLSTIQDSNIIAVLNQGAILEQGTHTELSAAGGAYAALISKYSPTTIKEEDNEEMPDVPAVRHVQKASTKSLLGDTASTAEYSLLPVSMSRMSSIAASLSAPVSFMLSKGSKTQKSMDLGVVDAEQQAEKIPPQRRLMALIQPERGLLVSGFLCAAVCGAVLPLLVWTLMSTTSVYYEPSDQVMGGVQKWALIMTGIAIIAGLAELIQSICFGTIGQRLAHRLRCMMMHSLVRQDVGYFDEKENNSGAIVSRLEADALHAKGQVSDNYGMFGQILGALLCGFPISFIYCWQEALIMLAVVPLVIIIAAVLLIATKKIATKSQDLVTSSESLATEAILNYKVVAAFNLQSTVNSAYQSQSESINKLAVKGAFIQGIGGGFLFFTLFSIYALAFWFGGQLLTNNNLSLNNILQGIFPLFIALVTAGQAQTAFPDVAKSSAAVERVYEILDRTPPIDSSSSDGVEPSSCAGALALKDVKFFYPQRPDVRVFRKLRLDIPAGTSAALVGPSGSGKSTVVALLLRFYDPVSGAVVLDNRPIKSLNIRWLRTQIGLVAQEPVLFNGTILDNIKYGRPGASLDECLAAAAIANATEFINALPSGVHTAIGDQSIQLSGGQKQRLAIARAVASNPKVLVLDEATSALDAASEGAVQTALDAAMVGRTAVVIAHRLSTVRAVGRIYVLAAGEVEEEGTHAELMAKKGGRYAAMVELQKLE